MTTNHAICMHNCYHVVAVVHPPLCLFGQMFVAGSVCYLCLGDSCEWIASLGVFGYGCLACHYLSLFGLKRLVYKERDIGDCWVVMADSWKG